MSTTVAMTGATGLLGRHLRPLLADRPVVLLTRREPERASNEHWRPTDLAGPVRLAGLPAGSALVHLAYAMDEHSQNIDHTEHLIDAVNGCPEIERVIVVSSVSVYGLRTNGLIDETTPCRPDSGYARTKLGCERLWFERVRPGCRLTVLRPTTVIAPGGPGLQTFARDAVERPLRGVVKRSLSGRSSVHFVAVTNVASAIRFTLDRPQPRHRETFVVSDDHRPENGSYARMQDAVRTLHGRRPLPTFPLPRWAERPLGTVLGRPLGVRRVFSSGALHAAGFQDAVTLAEELRRVVVDAAGRPPASGRL